MRYANVIVDKLRVLYVMLMLLLIPKKDDEKDEPVRLRKEENDEPINLKIDFDYKIILIFISFLIMFGILIYIIYKTGALESTNYYYRLNNY